MKSHFPRTYHLLFVLCLLSLLVAAGGSYSAAQAGAPAAVTVRVVGPAAPVAVGQPFTVAITAENVADLGAFEFEYQFTGSIVGTTVSAIQLGELLGSTGRTTGTLRMTSAPGLPGVPLFGAYSYGEAAGPDGNGVLATVTMTALATGTSPLRLNELKIVDRRGAVLASVGIAGSVTVINGVNTRSLYLPLVRRSTP